MLKLITWTFKSIKQLNAERHTTKLSGEVDTHARTRTHDGFVFVILKDQKIALFTTVNRIQYTQLKWTKAVAMCGWQLTLHIKSTAESNELQLCFFCVLNKFIYVHCSVCSHSMKILFCLCCSICMSFVSRNRPAMLSDILFFFLNILEFYSFGLVGQFVRREIHSTSLFNLSISLLRSVANH